MEDEITQTIVKLAQHCEGMRARDDRLKKWARTSVDRRLVKLVKAGTLHKVFLSPRNVRYYANERDAAVVQRRMAHVSLPQGAVRAVSVTRPEGWSRLPAEVTERTKFTKCPSPGERFCATPLPSAFVFANTRGRVCRG